MKRTDILIMVNIIILLSFIMYILFFENKSLSDYKYTLYVILTPLVALILNKYNVIKL